MSLEGLLFSERRQSQGRVGRGVVGGVGGGKTWEGEGGNYNWNAINERRMKI